MSPWERPEGYIGKCPICQEELEKSGDLAECPAGDYRAPIRKFIERWDLYEAEKAAPPDGYNEMQALESLLYDLQEMNIRRIKL